MNMQEIWDMLEESDVRRAEFEKTKCTPIAKLDTFMPQCGASERECNGSDERRRHAVDAQSDCASRTNLDLPL